MNKKFVLPNLIKINLFFILSLLSSCSINENLTLKAETNYHSSSHESLRTSATADYKFKIKEFKNGKNAIYFLGSLSQDYDHFGKTIKVNGFNGFSFEF
jgi:hypothetical protein